MPLHEYSDAVLDHYENPRNVGEAADANATATVESAECRDRLTLSLRIERGFIRDARFRAFGCVAAIAASSRVTEMLRGLDLPAAAAITDARVAADLGGLPPAKVHCSVLARGAIRAALQDYHARVAASAGGGEGDARPRPAPPRGAVAVAMDGGRETDSRAGVGKPAESEGP